MLLRFFFFIAIFSSVVSAMDSLPCKSSADCNNKGTIAYKQRDYEYAIVLYEKQLQYSELLQSNESAAEELALNNLMLANMKAGHVGKARAWMWVALNQEADGKATRLNIGNVIQAFDYSNQTNIVGRYERYAGMGLWSKLYIERNLHGEYLASFSLMRVGNPATVMEYGPAAVGELSGLMDGDNFYSRLILDGFPDACKVQFVHEGVDLFVVESTRDGCQSYGGAGIHVSGVWRKVSNLNDLCVNIRNESNASGFDCIKFSADQKFAALQLSLHLGAPFILVMKQLSNDGWAVDDKWLSENSPAQDQKYTIVPVCGQGFDAICHVGLRKGNSTLELGFSGANLGLPLISVSRFSN